MNELEYHQMVDTLFLKIEAWLEASDQEIDFDAQEGILTITFPGANDLILSRQPALQEVWLACAQGAFHFQYHQGNWMSKNQEMLIPVLVDCAKQANLHLDITKMTL